MDFEKLVSVAKTTNEKSVETVNHFLECIQKGKPDPELDIQVFLYSQLITLHLESELIKQIQDGISKVKEEMKTEEDE